MQEWLTNDQKIDPFNPNNPLDADEFCDDLHRYWSMHYKNEKVTKDKGKDKNKGDETNQQNSQKKSRHTNSGGRTGDNASQAGRGGSQGCCGNNNEGGQGNRGRCSIIGHENHRND